VPAAGAADLSDRSDRLSFPPTQFVHPFHSHHSLPPNLIEKPLVTERSLMVNKPIVVEKPLVVKRPSVAKIEHMRVVTCFFIDL